MQEHSFLHIKSLQPAFSLRPFGAPPSRREVRAQCIPLPLCKSIPLCISNVSGPQAPSVFPLRGKPPPSRREADGRSCPNKTLWSIRTIYFSLIQLQFPKTLHPTGPQRYTETKSPYFPIGNNQGQTPNERERVPIEKGKSRKPWFSGAFPPAFPEKPGPAR